MAPKVLFVLTSHNTINTLDRPTGWFLPEFAHPYYKLVSNFEITVASPAGGEAPIDPGSIEMTKGDEESQRFLAGNQSLWTNTERLDKFVGRAGEFEAIFFVGGHGPMYDLAHSSVSHQITREFYESSKIVAAVCHGSAALVNVKLSNGAYMIAGQRVTGFSNDEEEQAGLTKAMPFLLETKLKENSGHAGLYEKAKSPWDAHVVVSGKDDNLITGQNPASAGPIGEAILKAILRSSELK